MAKTNQKPEKAVSRNNVHDLRAQARQSFEKAGLTVKQSRELAVIYEDLLIVDSFATVLRDALYEHCEDYGAHYGNLIDSMRGKLRASWETLDYMGCNTLAHMESITGERHDD